MDVFDKVNWRPIDDSIITEIHEKHQIFPCTFPHTDYLRKHNVKSPKSTKIAKNAQIAKPAGKFLKIQPFDDSFEVIDRDKLKKKLNKNRIAAIESQKIKHKKQKSRMKKKAICNALKDDSKALKDAKDLLIATMDQYNPLTGKPLQKSAALGAESACSSVAYGTRRKSSCPNTPGKQQGHVRRSDRMVSNDK